MNEVDDYIFNKIQVRDTEEFAKYKIVPTDSDQEVFFDLMSMQFEKLKDKYLTLKKGKYIPADGTNRALNSYLYFHSEVCSYVNHGQLNSQTEEIDQNDTDSDSSTKLIELFQSLLKAVLQKMKVVIIHLEKDDNPQAIYESINSKNEPLLAMDLVRNDIFFRAEQEGVLVDEFYREFWSSFENSWWGNDAPNARPKRPRIDHFLLHVLIAQTGQKISMNNLFSEYRSFATSNDETKFENVKEEIELLNEYRPIYETLEGRENINASLKRIGEKMRYWQATTPYPIIMQIFQRQEKNNEKMILFDLLYSYIVRRTVCGLSNSNLNRVFQSLADFFIKSSPSVNKLKEFLENNSTKSTRFPRDEEFWTDS